MPVTEPIFYSLPATNLGEGMSTDDGQDILDVTIDDTAVYVHVYTPRSDDADLDEENRSAPELRMYPLDASVDLAVFPDTTVDGRQEA